MSAHAPQICESITNKSLQPPNSHLLPQYFFLLNKICDGGSLKEPFLKAATLSILIWAYPRKTKTNNGNFKNAAISPCKIAHAWRAYALILPLYLIQQSICDHAHNRHRPTKARYRIWVSAGIWKSSEQHRESLHSIGHWPLMAHKLIWYFRGRSYVRKVAFLGSKLC